MARKILSEILLAFAAIVTSARLWTVLKNESDESE